MIDVLQTFKFEEMRGTTRLVQEPVGVCALITPWNWPMNQVAAKVVPAFGRRLHHGSQALGVFAIQRHPVGQGHARGRGSRGRIQSSQWRWPERRGAAVCAPRYRLVSFTGSTRGRHGGRAQLPPRRSKRVHQELGGKSPNVLLDDADFERAVKQSVLHVFQNSGQSCNAPTRMLVPAAKMAAVEAIAKRVAESVVVGDPSSDKTTVGPVVSNCNSSASKDLSPRELPKAHTLVAGGAGRLRA